MVKALGSLASEMEAKSGMNSECGYLLLPSNTRCSVACARPSTPSFSASVGRQKRPRIVVDFCSTRYTVMPIEKREREQEAYYVHILLLVHECLSVCLCVCNAWISNFLWTDFDAVFCIVLGMVQKVQRKISTPMDFVALIKLRWCARTTTWGLPSQKFEFVYYVKLCVGMF